MTSELHKAETDAVIHTEAHARQIIEHHHDSTIGELFPEISETAPLSSLPLPTRVANRFNGSGDADFSGLASRTVGELLAWQGIGKGSTIKLLTGLGTFESPEADQPPANGSSEFEPWAKEALADIETLARWHRLLGGEDSSVFVVEDGIAEPQNVVSARERLARLSASSVLPAVAGNGPAGDLIEHLLDGFDERDIRILRRRAFAETLDTLESLGAEFNVTRESIRQRETKAKLRLATLIDESELSALADAMRAEITDVLPVRSLLQRFPSLTDVVDTLDAPVWRILDRLDEEYEIRDTWAAAPSVKDAVARTRELLRTAAGGRAYVELATLEVHDPGTISDDWLTYCDVKRLLGFAFVGSGGIADRAAVVLEAEELPLATEVILERLGVERALSALKNALAADDRFLRVGKDAWALSRWGLKGYQSIKKSIAQIVDAAGTGVPLAQLIEEITAQAAVSANSITTYAAAHPFITKSGVVRRRTRREMRRTGHQKGLAQTRGLYRHSESIKYRIAITGEHLRGSGTPLPTALGAELDLLPSEKRELPARGGGKVTVSWRGPQIAIGSVQEEVVDRGFEPGDVAFLVFHADGSFEIERPAPGAEPVARLASLTGGTFDGEPLEELGDRIASDALTAADIAHALTARGEHQLADLLARVSVEAE